MTKLKECKLIAKRAGDNTETLPHYFTEWAYKGVPINHVLDYTTWYDNVCTEIEERDRFEYVMYDEYDQLVGAMVWTKDYDTVVGDCLFVQWAFSHHPRALLRGYKILFKMAKQLGVKHVLYTHLIKHKSYGYEYREVK